MPRVLALDVATVTGYAHDTPGRPGVPTSGRFRAPSPVNGAFGKTFFEYRWWLMRLVSAAKPELLVFEAPLHIAGAHGSNRPTNQNTARVLIGLAGLTELVAFELQLPCEEAHLGTVKAHFAGSGRADKRAMLARCQQLGWETGGDDNRADACAVWSLAKSLKEPKFAPAATPLFARAPA